MGILKKKTAQRISNVVLLLAGVMDIRRGVAHTFNVRYSAEHLAGIEPISDSLVLMGAFGISNFLSGFIYFLVIWKAKHLAPYILLLIPICYFIGGLGMKYQDVQVESAFVGRYMMAVYLSICLITSLAYLLIKFQTTRKIVN
jgi:hypothetical protein